MTCCCVLLTFSHSFSATRSNWDRIEFVWSAKLHSDVLQHLGIFLFPLHSLAFIASLRSLLPLRHRPPCVFPLCDPSPLLPLTCRRRDLGPGSPTRRGRVREGQCAARTVRVREGVHHAQVPRYAHPPLQPSLLSYLLALRLVSAVMVWA